MSVAMTCKYVHYLHHTCDADGNVIFFFVDPRDKVGVRYRSSPVRALRRTGSTVLDLQGRGNLGKYLIVTQNSEYEVQMPCERAEHLAAQLRGHLRAKAGSSDLLFDPGRLARPVKQFSPLDSWSRCAPPRPRPACPAGEAVQPREDLCGPARPPRPARGR